MNFKQARENLVHICNSKKQDPICNRILEILPLESENYDELFAIELSRLIKINSVDDDLKVALGTFVKEAQREQYKAPDLHILNDVELNSTNIIDLRIAYIKLRAFSNWKSRFSKLEDAGRFYLDADGIYAKAKDSRTSWAKETPKQMRVFLCRIKGLKYTIDQPRPDGRGKEKLYNWYEIMSKTEKSYWTEPFESMANYTHCCVKIGMAIDLHGFLGIKK